MVLHPSAVRPMMLVDSNAVSSQAAMLPPPTDLGKHTLPSSQPFSSSPFHSTPRSFPRPNTSPYSRNGTSAPLLPSIDELVSSLSVNEQQLQHPRSASANPPQQSWHGNDSFQFQSDQFHAGLAAGRQPSPPVSMSVSRLLHQKRRRSTSAPVLHGSPFFAENNIVPSRMPSHNTVSNNDLANFHYSAESQAHRRRSSSTNMPTTNTSRPFSPLEHRMSRTPSFDQSILIASRHISPYSRNAREISRHSPLAVRNEFSQFTFSSKRPKRKLPASATKILKSWLAQHLKHPYPTEKEKRELCEATGLSLVQINNWYAPVVCMVGVGVGVGLGFGGVCVLRVCRRAACVYTSYER